MPTARSIRTGYLLSGYFDNAFIANKKGSGEPSNHSFRILMPLVSHKRAASLIRFAQSHLFDEKDT